MHVMNRDEPVVLVVRALGVIPLLEVGFQLLTQLEELRLALVHHTGRALLDRGGLHLMRYPVGSKFLPHVDEDPR